ncbi:hypothetical protein Sked_28980 [Sanguibacter keddieii DSM 10542]|uniref:Sortase (Surface protein transpeptidase) n=1 Tax=Sanguibacter keddieii (strain ATCC 51767 / DSM 10542 / NCFB 3025 / ST-74) TaxID=446469 RepID=D1BBM9_SANKS|nr:hypothetical protein [Sanguibacter keddieii]ACZ22800.1 hypothetical protein Sked_28980 [Sanguibacter keddieii DSM 10542]
MSRRSAGWVVGLALLAVGTAGCVSALPEDQAVPIQNVSMEEETGVQRTVETTGRSGIKASGAPPVADQVEVEPAVKEAPAQSERAPASAPVANEVAQVATGALTIPSLGGWSEQIVEEVAFVEGSGVLKPQGRGLALVTGLPEPWSAGQILLVHSGGAPENPGNRLVERDAGSTIAVGAEVVLPDGSPGVVTYSDVSPKSLLPRALWDALAEGDTVLVTCRPETGLDSSTSNSITIIERT